MKPLVAVIMGSDSDLPKMNDAIEILQKFKVPHEVKVVSAHRTPKFMVTYASKASSRGIKVIIAGAGGAAHLPGMVASLTDLPVIGVPIEVGKLKGLDAVLSVVQMPKGVPVATMALDNSFNAALMAAKILALNSKRLKTELNQFYAQQKLKVKHANKKVSQQFLD